MSSALIPLSVEVHKYLEKVGAYEKVKNWIMRKKAYPVIVLGASGVGKTSLIKTLFGEPARIRRQDRSDEVKEVTAKLEKKLFIKLIDTPGEQQHEAKRKVALRQAMKFKSVGIINVVAYGFHEGSSSKDDALTSKGKPSQEFLQRRREVERDLLKEWVHLLCGTGGPAHWVTTVVTKADLWWERSADQPVIDYYNKEPYISALAEAAALPHSVKPYASTRHLFYDSMPMSGYYSDEQRTDDHNALIAHILEKASDHG
jgi:GTP-binding protein EngB required for normal cell division